MLHSAFYRFVTLPEPEAAAAAVRELGRVHGLLGSVVLAAEGINGTVAGTGVTVATFEAALQAMQGGLLQGTRFMHSCCATAPFGRWKVTVRPEIVALGLPATKVLPAPAQDDGSHLTPQQWRDMLRRKEAVVLDNRNHFEFRLGHFRGATDPQVYNFRDFAHYVRAQAPQWLAEDRPVAMYCTGGVRCDKTAPWLRSLGLNVLQLQGGILNYFAQMRDAQDHWQGECFVFDRRMALGCDLQETATSAEQIYDPQRPDEAWRLQRAVELDLACATSKPASHVQT